MAYKSPVRDFTFILNEVLEIDRYTNQPGFQDVSSDLVNQILEEGAKGPLAEAYWPALLAVIDPTIDAKTPDGD